jgi:hypothetical protein
MTSALVQVHVPHDLVTARKAAAHAGDNLAAALAGASERRYQQLDVFYKQLDIAATDLSEQVRLSRRT